MWMTALERLGTNVATSVCILYNFVTIDGLTIHIYRLPLLTNFIDKLKIALHLTN